MDDKDPRKSKQPAGSQTPADITAREDRLPPHPHSAAQLFAAAAPAVQEDPASQDSSIASPREVERAYTGHFCGL